MDFNDSSRPFHSQQSLDEKIVNEEFLYMFVNFVSVFVDVFMLVVIMRYKSLQTKNRIFIVNWAVTDLFFLVFNSSMYRLYSQIHEKMEIYEFFCMFSQTEYLVLALKAAFVLMLHSDFAFERINLKSFKYTVISCWAVVLILAVISGGYCFRQTYNGFSVLIYLIIFSILFATCICKIISAIKSNKFRRGQKLTVRYVMTSCYVLCWFVSWICLVLDVCFDVSENSNIFLVAISVGNVLGYGNAIVNLLLLINMDPNFMKGCLLTVRCSSSQNVGNEFVEEEHALPEN